MEHSTSIAKLGAIALLIIALLMATVVLASPGADDQAPQQQGQSTWLPGLPIDTPPAVASPLLATAPAGEEKHWEAVAAWARGACSFDLGQAEGPPEAIFKTTAGEFRRRSAELKPDGLPLGSNWHNEDTLFVVVYRGVFPHRPEPRPLDGSAADAPPPGNACVYYGNGKTDNSDNVMVDHTTLRRSVATAEDLLAQQ